MVRIALSNVFRKQWGASIRRVAPQQIELASVDADETRWKSAEILIHSEYADGLTPAVLVAQMPRLRWLHTIYAGTDDLPWKLIGSRKLLVTNSAGVYAPMMVEYIIAMLVMHYRRLHEHTFAQHTHHSRGPVAGDSLNGELYGKRIGIFGIGAVGRRLAIVANALGMRVWAVRRTPTIDANEPVERMLDLSELGEFWRACDIIALTASLNAGTRGIVGAREFRLMKRGALLVNVARGALVDETALVSALARGKLGGAILDVTTIEPLPPESPLWETPNLLLTPHISGEMPVGRERSIHLFRQNLRLYKNGKIEWMGNLTTNAKY